LRPSANVAEFDAAGLQPEPGQQRNHNRDDACDQRQRKGIVATVAVCDARLQRGIASCVN
jgi:hypothetical protein